MKRLVLSLLVLCSGAVAQEAKKKEDVKKPEESKAATWTAIVGGTIWPVSGPVIRDGVVLVKDTKIAVVGRRDEVTVPKGATVVDATGRHVSPGFVCSAARGALGVSGHNLREKARDRFDPFNETMLFCLAAGITTAHEGPSSGGGFAGFGRGGGSAFSGSFKGSYGGVIGKLTRGTIEGFEVRDPAGVYMTYGGTGSQRNETRAAFAKAIEYRKNRKQWLEDVVAKKKDAKEPKSDDVTKALAKVLDRELPLFMGASTRQQLEGCLDLCDDYKVPMVVHGGQEAWTMAPSIGRRPITMLITPRGSGGRATRPYTNLHKTRPHGWSITNAAVLSSAGITWGVTTSGTGINTRLFAGRDLMGLPHEACFAVRGGATEADALAAITLTAAQILKIDDRVGSLEAGKDADILVMDREPLDYRSFVDLAYVNGRVAYERSKVDLWNHIQTDRSKGMKKGWKPWGPWPELGELTPPSEAGGNGNGGN